MDSDVILVKTENVETRQYTATVDGREYNFVVVIKDGEFDKLVYDLQRMYSITDWEAIRLMANTVLAVHEEERRKNELYFKQDGAQGGLYWSRMTKSDSSGE